MLFPLEQMAWLKVISPKFIQPIRGLRRAACPEGKFLSEPVASALDQWPEFVEAFGADLRNVRGRAGGTWEDGERAVEIRESRDIRCYVVPEPDLQDAKPGLVQPCRIPRNHRTPRCGLCRIGQPQGFHFVSRSNW